MKKKEYYNKIVELHSKMFDKMFDDNVDMDVGTLREKKLKRNFVNEYAEEVINCAYENCKPNSGDGVVLLTPEGKITGATFNTKVSPSTKFITSIEVYRLNHRFADDFEVEMLIDLDEWDQLKEMYGKDADFLDKSQLQNIDVDLDQRIKKFLLDVIKIKEIENIIANDPELKQQFLDEKYHQKCSNILDAFLKFAEDKGLDL